MIEKLPKVTNPLTIVAVFAALVEVFGSVTIPFVAHENQSLFIWFLALFAFTLLLLFFVTMNFNHRVLYAPSDWKDEENFFRPATAKEKAAKLEQDIAEQDSLVEVHPEPPALAADPAGREASIIRDPARLQSIEKAALIRAGKKYGQIRKEQLVVDAAGRKILFDGIVIGTDRNWALEVKFISDHRSTSSISKVIIRREIERFESRKPLLPSNLSENLGLIIIIVVETIDEAARGRLQAELHSLAAAQRPDVRIELYALKDLNI